MRKKNTYNVYLLVDRNTDKIIKSGKYYKILDLCVNKYSTFTHYVINKIEYYGRNFR